MPPDESPHFAGEVEGLGLYGNCHDRLLIKRSANLRLPPLPAKENRTAGKRALEMGLANSVGKRSFLWFALNGTLIVRGQERVRPPIPSTPRRQTTDPCNEAETDEASVAYLY
jgi:hypothetical protein